VKQKREEIKRERESEREDKYKECEETSTWQPAHTKDTFYSCSDKRTQTDKYNNRTYTRDCRGTSPISKRREWLRKAEEEEEKEEEKVGAKNKME